MSSSTIERCSSGSMTASSAVRISSVLGTGVIVTNPAAPIAACVQKETRGAVGTAARVEGGEGATAAGGICGRQTLPLPVSPSRTGQARALSLNEAQDAFLDSAGKLGHPPVGEVAPVLGDGVATAFEIADAFFDAAAALAQFALEADARFADLAFETVARGCATPLEAPELGLRPRGCGVVGDGVVDAREHAVARDQRGADGYQQRALGVVAEGGDGQLGRACRALRGPACRCRPACRCGVAQRARAPRFGAGRFHFGPAFARAGGGAARGGGFAGRFGCAFGARTARVCCGHLGSLLVVYRPA